MLDRSESGVKLELRSEVAYGLSQLPLQVIFIGGLFEYSSTIGWRFEGGDWCLPQLWVSEEKENRSSTSLYRRAGCTAECFIYAVITGLGMNYHSRQWIFRKTPEFPHTSAKQWHLKQHIRLINWCMDLDACVIILCNIWSYCCPSWSGHSCKRFLISRVFPLEG